MRRFVLILFLMLLFQPSFGWIYNTINQPASDGLWKSNDFILDVTWHDSYGLSYCYYAVDYLSGSSWINILFDDFDCHGSDQYSASYTITVGSNGHCRTEGVNKCRLRAGILGAPGEVQRLVSIDYSPPSTSISPYTYNWVNYNVGFNLHCSDSGRGCKESHYEIVNTETGSIVVPHTISSSGTVTCSDGQECKRTVYYHSKDNQGHEDYMKSRDYLIDKKAPTPNPASMASLDMKSNSATVYSHAASDEGSGVDRYIFSDGSRDSWSSVNYAYFSGLTPDTEYCFNVHYIDKLGNSGSWSNYLCGTTKVAIPFIASTQSISPSTIVINIDTRGNPSHVRYKAYYEDEYKTVTGETEWNGGETKVYVNGLQPNKKYRFKVKALGNSGESADWSSFSGYRYTLANRVSNLDISNYNSFTPQGIISSLNNPIGLVEPFLPLESCSSTPIIMHGNGTLEYSIGVKTGEVISKEIINISLCGNEYYHVVGSQDTPLELNQEIVTECLPYDAYYDPSTQTIIIFKKKFKITYIGDLIVTNLDDIPYEGCSSENINIPNPTCTGLTVRQNGVIDYNLGLRFQYNDMSFGCLGGQITQTGVLPVETPCYPTAVEQLDNNNARLRFEKTIITSINVADPINSLGIRNEYCYTLGKYGSNVYNFEDGKWPAEWTTYLFRHPAGHVDSDLIVDSGLALYNSAYRLFDRCSPRIDMSEPVYDFLPYHTNKLVLKNGWNVTKETGYNSKYSIKPLVSRDLQTGIIQIPIIVDKPSKIQFDYKTNGYYNGDKDVVFRTMINGMWTDDQGISNFEAIPGYSWIIPDYNIGYTIWGLVYGDTYQDYMIPPNNNWASFDSSRMYEFGSYLHPGLNVVTIEFGRGTDGSCNANKLAYIDNFRVVTL